MSSNLVNIADWKQKQQPEDDISERIKRIQASIKRINNLMSEIREMNNVQRKE